MSKSKLLERDRLQQFDVVLANPPYSIKTWDRKLWAADPYGRNRFGTPPQGRADYAFFQHIIASMKAGTGRSATLFPHGVLFRDEEREMRKRIIEADLIDCVLGLGPGLFYNSPMEACVLFCRTEKPADRKGKVLFINAVNEYAREQAQSFLSDDHIERIVSAFRTWHDEPGFSRVVDVEALLRRDGSLNIGSYVVAARPESEADADPSVTPQQALDAWLSQRSNVEGHLVAMLEALEGVRDVA